MSNEDREAQYARMAINVLIKHLGEALHEIRLEAEKIAPRPIHERQLFPKELEELLQFEDKGQWIEVSLKHFVGSEKFSQIMAIVRELNGEYVSAGKDSHFKIPKG